MDIQYINRIYLYYVKKSILLTIRKRILNAVVHLNNNILSETVIKSEVNMKWKNRIIKVKVKKQYRSVVWYKPVREGLFKYSGRGKISQCYESCYVQYSLNKTRTVCP